MQELVVALRDVVGASLYDINVSDEGRLVIGLEYTETCSLLELAHSLVIALFPCSLLAFLLLSQHQHCG